jgi:hypothetical protein
MKKFLYLISLSIASLSFARTEVATLNVHHHPISLIKGAHSMPHTPSDEEIGRTFMEVVDHDKNARSLVELGWDYLPTEDNEDIDGLSETYLLEGYKKLYLLFEVDKDALNAAKALWRGLQVQEYEEGLFSAFVKDLGIKNIHETEEEISKVLQARFSSEKS